MRGVPRRPVQPGDPRGALQGQDHLRGARHVDRGGRRVLRADHVDPPVPEDARRRRARLRAARPARARRCPAARRSASSWPPSCRSGRPGAPSTSSTSRPPACTSRTSASCSRSSTAWWTRATRSSSSSTTSTSSRPPTGSSTWGPRAAAAAAPSSRRAPRRTSRPCPESYTGQFLAEMLTGARAREEAAQGQRLADAHALRQRRREPRADPDAVEPVGELRRPCALNAFDAVPVRRPRRSCSDHAPVGVLGPAADDPAVAPRRRARRCRCGRRPGRGARRGTSPGPASPSW